MVNKIESRHPERLDGTEDWKIANDGKSLLPLKQKFYYDSIREILIIHNNHKAKAIGSMNTNTSKISSF